MTDHEGGDEEPFDEIDDVVDAEPEAPTSEKVKEKAAGATAKGVTTTMKIIPFRQRLFKKFAVKSIENLHKTAGGDALALDARAGQQLELTPVKYRTPEQCDEGEKPGWKAKGEDKVWNAGSEGRVVDYLGRTPIVALDRDSHVEAGWLRPRIAEAIELDKHQPLYTNPDLDVVVDMDDPTAGAGDAAVADGGMSYELELNDPGRWIGDSIIDLDSGEGYDGMRLSFRKATEWMAETTTTQEMQMQEDRGFLRGKMSAGQGPSTFKLLLLCAAIILGVLAIVIMGPQLVGGDGGGGGASMNPLSIALTTALGAV